MSLTLPPATSSGSKCWYALIELPDGDRAQLDEWIADPRIAAERIAGALTEYGISGQQVGNHRKKHVLSKKPCR